MVRYKYTPEALAVAAAQSHNVTEVMRVLGVRLSGGSHAHISRQLKKFGIDTSHFTGQAHLRGRTGYNRINPVARLVVMPPGSRRIEGKKLKRAMIAIGLPERCELCGVGSTWMGRPLTLHVDHISGDFLDNRPQNVRFACPNCHSQTATYAGATRDPGAPCDVIYDESATTPTGIPLGRRIPDTTEWLWNVYAYASKGP
jgi:hypothetical protein